MKTLRNPHCSNSGCVNHLPTLTNKFPGSLSIALFILLGFFLIPLGSVSQLWKHYDQSNSKIASNIVWSLAKGKNGVIYLGGAGGLNYVENDSMKIFNAGNVFVNDIRSIWVYGDTLYIVAGRNDLLSVTKNVWKSYSNYFGFGLTLGMGISKKDTLYRVADNGSFGWWNGLTWKDIIPSNVRAHTIFIDKEDNIWLLSTSIGLTKYKNGQTTSWSNSIDPSSPQYIPSVQIHDMVQDSTGIYWLASNNGLLRFNGTHFQVFNKANSGIASNFTRSMAIDKSGKIWIGTLDSGLCSYDGINWKTYNVVNSPLKSNIINDVLVDDSNRVWIAHGSRKEFYDPIGQGILVMDQSKDATDNRLPNAPAGIRGKVISNAEVVISWDDLSDNENGFIVERSVKDSFNFKQVKFLPDNSNRYTDLTVIDTAYYYRIRSTNNLGNSDWSPMIKVTPKYCPILRSKATASASVGKMSFGSITQKTPPCSRGYIDYLDLRTEMFKGKTLLLNLIFDRCNFSSDRFGSAVYFDWNSDGDFFDNGELVYSNINMKKPDSFRIPVTVPDFVEVGAIVRLRILADDDINSLPIGPCTNAEQVQDYTIEITAAPIAAPAGNLILAPKGSTKMDIVWTDNGVNETGFIIQRSIDSVLFTDLANLPPNTVQYLDSLLQPSTKYYYRVITQYAASNAASASSGVRTLPADLIREWPGAIAVTTGFNEGAYWGDYNSDGKYDLFAPRFSVLFKNENNSFVNSTIPFLNSNGAAWADFDNDGDQDIFVSDNIENINNPGNYLYENNGNGTFTRKEVFAPNKTVINVVWSDFNKDGFLDLYVSFRPLGFGQPGYGELYQNQKDKSFTMVKRFDGAFGHASFADYDTDGDDDLIVRLYGTNGMQVYNLEFGVFNKDTSSNLNSLSVSSYALSWADYDNDGDLDFYSTGRYNSILDAPYLFRNMGSGNFSPSIIDYTGGLSYGSAWGDYDNDGFIDLFISKKDSKNRLIYNQGDGTFTELSESIFINENFETYPSGSFGSMGCAWADYNNDGFLDLYVATYGATSRLFKNATNGNNWINISLKGIISNADGIGAVIQLKSNGKWQYRTIESTSGYASENSRSAEFGIGQSASIDSLIVRWPSGNIQYFTNVQRNTFLTITEPNICVNNVWTGQIDSIWENPGNWSCGSVPNQNSNVYIPPGTTVIINSNVTIRKLTIARTATLRVNENFSLTITN